MYLLQIFKPHSSSGYIGKPYELGEEFDDIRQNIVDTVSDEKSFQPQPFKPVTLQ